MGFKGLNLKEHDKFSRKGPQAKKGEFFEISFNDEDLFNNKNNKEGKSKEEDKA